MEEKDNLSNDYIKGFNYGYLVAQHIPDLAKQISTARSDTDKLKGLLHGISEFQKEKTTGLLPKWLNKDILSELGKDNPKDDKHLDKE